MFHASHPFCWDVGSLITKDGIPGFASNDAIVLVLEREIIRPHTLIKEGEVG